VRGAVIGPTSLSKRTTPSEGFSGWVCPKKVKGGKKMHEIRDLTSRHENASPICIA